MTIDPDGIYDTVIISDIHLGIKNPAIGRLYYFLKTTQCNTLILNGDIVDGWRLDRRRKQPLPEMQEKVLEAIHDKIVAGTEVIYIPGNHDDELRRMKLHNKKILGMTVKKELVHKTPDGRKYFISHGDQFDMSLGRAARFPESLKVIGGFFYGAGMVASDTFDKAHRRIRKADFKLFARLHYKFSQAAGMTRAYEERVFQFARKQGYDAVICGHTHVPALKKSKDGIVYANTGDWVENFTALAIDKTGNIEQLDWHRPDDYAAVLRAALTETAERHPRVKTMIEQIDFLWPGKG